MLIVGLISGTSLDGIDVALTEVAEERAALSCKLRDFATVPYSAELQASLFALLDARAAAAPALATLRDICALNFAIGEEFARAAQRVIASNSAHPQLIASHGQTLYHLVQPDGRTPFARSTLQMGEPAVIAQRTGVTCVADFRVADVAAGGQGAPLVAYADYELLRAPAESRALLNLGGIANVSIVVKGANPEGVSAFDTGPGNMLIDFAMRSLFDPSQRFDRNGEIANQGTVNGPLLAWLLAHPYFARPAPKTTGHEEFGSQYFGTAWSKAEALGCAREDFVATLTQLTARTIAAALPDGIDRIVVSGGGAHNATLLRMLAAALRERFRQAPVISLSDDFGLPVDAKEAMAFALLGLQAVRGECNNLSASTGAQNPVILGKIVPGANYRALMQSLWQS